MNELTFTERNDYTKRLQRLKKWTQDRFQISLDLLHIRDNQLYKEDYKTFEDFCKTELEISRPRAYQLIDFAEQKKLGSEAKNERQSRDSKMSTMVDKSREFEPKIIDSEEIICDKTEAHFEVPEAILNDWKRADEVGKEVIRKVSELKCFLEKGKNDDDVIFRELSITASAYAANLYTAVKSIPPYAVCTSCQGIQANKCVTCKGRGFFSKDFYDRAIPSEVKTLRNRVGK